MNRSIHSGQLQLDVQMSFAEILKIIAQRAQVCLVLVLPQGDNEIGHGKPPEVRQEGLTLWDGVYIR